MVARFLRFYTAYTLEAVLSMRARQFFVLNAKIRTVQLEEEAQSLSITHHGKPGERLREIVDELNRGSGRKIISGNHSLKLLAEGHAQAVASDEIAAIRERQKQAALEMKADPVAYRAKVLAALAEKQAPSG